MPHVYIIRNGSSNIFKIGITKGDPNKRLKSLQIGNPTTLSFYCLLETDSDTDHHLLIERYLHAYFCKHQVREGVNREHFVLTEEQLDQGISSALEFQKSKIPVIDKANELKKIDAGQEMIEPDDECKMLYEKLLDVRFQVKDLEFKKKLLEDQLKIRIGALEGINGIATWKTQTREVVNIKELKAKYPKIAEEFIRVSKNRILRII